MKFIIQINGWIKMKKVKMLTSFNGKFHVSGILRCQNLVQPNLHACQINPTSLSGILSVKIWLTQTCFPHNPKHLSGIWSVKIWWSQICTCKHDSLNRVIMVHGRSSSSWRKTLRKTSHKHLFTYTKFLPSLVTHRISQSRSKAGG